MSTLSIRKYFSFSKVKMESQRVASDGSISWIEVTPDKRYLPVCAGCKRGTRRIKEDTKRYIRDLNMGKTQIHLGCTYRKLRCEHCSVNVEDLGFFEPYQRVTKRLARYIYDLCKVMTIKDVAEHTGLNWKTVKKIDKTFLKEEFDKPNYNNLKILGIDEIAIKKGHNYLTVVMNYETGQVLWMRKDRRTETLGEFFETMSSEQRAKIEAVSMDMWDPYIGAVQKYCPDAKIVFDFFHVVKEYSKVIDKVRNQEYRKASDKDKEVIKGSRYLLLKNTENLKEEHKPKLKQLLELNENLNTCYILKDLLKQIWTYIHPTWANKAIDKWIQLAKDSGIKEVIQFSKRLNRHRYGIINHCFYPINNGIVEGTNNKIKVIKRDAYGFTDIEYFILKVKQATSVP